MVQKNRKSEMKAFTVLIFLLVFGIIPAQHKTSGLNRNDSLLNLLLQKHLLGTQITYGKKGKLIKGEAVNDTLYIYINKKAKKTVLSELNNKLQSINDSLIYSGYLFNCLEPDSIHIQNQTLHVFYHYMKTEQHKIDSLVIISDKKFPNNIRNRLYKMLKAKFINLKNLNHINRFITESTGYIITKQPVINFYHGKKMVVLKVKKETSNLLDGMLGFNYDTEKEKLQLEGRIKSSFYNLFNIGEQLGLIWQRKNKYQQIQLNAKFPYIKSSNLGIDNSFSSTKNDTISFEVFNQTGLNYKVKNQTFGINYIYNFKSSDNIAISNRLAGILYHINIKNKKTTWAADFGAQYNINLSNIDQHLFYLQLKSKEKIWHNMSLSHNLQIYRINQDKLNVPSYIQNDIFRKIVNLETNYNRILSVKNDIIYRVNQIKFYLIGDYIQTNSFYKQYISYANTGIGMHFINKNQILTFEIIKPVEISYIADFQGIYINIKQSIKF